MGSGDERTHLGLNAERVQGGVDVPQHEQAQQDRGDDPGLRQVPFRAPPRAGRGGERGGDRHQVRVRGFPQGPDPRGLPIASAQMPTSR